MLDPCCQHATDPHRIELGIPCSCNPPTWTSTDEEEDELDQE